jgi:glyoxylase-like metal-dependent hydrolase (beta-lactamase superfamily II)
MLKYFEFNPFAENTWIVYDDSGACAIFDPGCYTVEECRALRAFIEENGLKPARLILTHAHLDHVFGARFVQDTWQLPLEVHQNELPLLERFQDVCRMYGIPGAQTPPEPDVFLNPGDLITFGNTRLEALYTPGHSPGSLSFYNRSEGYVLAGDVLFMESIGRTDLPGGDHDTLIESIRRELFSLPDETIVYPGHGPATTIRHEKAYNPFLS